MVIYLYKDREGQAKGSLFFLEDALSRYLEGACLKEEKTCVFKDEKGKPRVGGNRLFVSASHSGEWVACAVSDAEVGIDIQNVRSIDGDRILRRFGTSEEEALTAAEGSEAFFEIWCRKEAFSKYVGEGLSYGLGKIQTCINFESDGKNTIRLAEEISGVKMRSGLLPHDKTMYFAVAGEGEIEWKLCDWCDNE